MAKHSQRHRSTTLPFRYRDDGLEFAVESYSLDGGKPKEVNLPPGQRTIDVSPGSRGDPDHDEETWNWATLYGRLRLNDATVEALFPSEERRAPPAKLYVAVRCHETIYRDSVVVHEPPTTPGEYEVKVRLDWEKFRGTVELRPYLVRTRSGPGGDGYAASKNVKVASGSRYEVIVDHWDDGDHPAIDGEEVRFSQAPHLPDEDRLYYLDFRNESRPKLWINADHPRIADVLRSEGSVGAEPRMRDVILDQISYATWNQLLFHSARAIDRNGDVEYEWQQTVLETFAPDLYDVDDVEEAKHLLREELTDAGGVANVVSRVDGELQTFIDPGTQLINLMEEGLQI